MSKRFVFPSVAHPSIRYVIYEGWSDAFTGRSTNSAINPHIGAYDTLGDDEVQHTPEYCPQSDSLADFLESFLIVLDKIEGFPNWLASFWRFAVPSDDQIEFARDLRYRNDEAPTIYYNLPDRKKSTDSRKRHDKRWVELYRDSESNLLRRVCSILMRDGAYCSSGILSRIGPVIRVASVLDCGYSPENELATYSVFKDMDRIAMNSMLIDYKAIDGFVDALRMVAQMKSRAESVREAIAKRREAVATESVG